MRMRTTVVTCVVFSFLWSSSAMAQQSASMRLGRPAAAEGRHVVDPAVMHQAIADQVATDQANRDAVVGVLHRSQVRDLADRLGLNVIRAEGAVSTLNSTELAQLAIQARTADAQLAGGGNTVTLSVTTLLLILIIVILVAR